MRLLGLLPLAIAAAATLSACAADSVSEPEPEGETESELNPGEDGQALTAGGGVDCKSTRMTAYDNGKPYSIDVITISGKHVSKTTGHAFLKMQAAAKKAGVTIGLSSGFRTQEEQQYFYNCYVHDSCNNGNLAAKPGYSNHQNGRALDLTTSSWLASHASNFGFARTVPSEAWHYEYRGADPGGPCGGAAAGASASASGDDDDTVGAPTPAPAPSVPHSAPLPTKTPAPASPTAGGGKRCGSDGQCNPGNDGSGLICSSGQCVPGCRSNAQCPGVTRCVSGQCR